MIPAEAMLSHPPFTIAEEIQFWSRQIKEHLQFIAEGITDNAAGATFKKQALFLNTLWFNVHHNSYEKPHVLKLCHETESYQTRLLNALKTRPWMGYLSYSFVLHMQKELLYFKSKLVTQEYDLMQEIDFWLWHHESEVEAISKLVDVSEKDIALTLKRYTDQVIALKKDLTSLSQNLYQLSDLHAYTLEILNEYLDHTENLQDDINNKTLLTNISPVLIAHAIREGEHAIEIIVSILKTIEN